MAVKFDKLDLMILAELSENCKQSVRQLARKLGTHPNTVMQRVKNLEKEKIVLKYSARIDFNKLGYDFYTMVLVKTKKGELKDPHLLDNIGRIPQVESFHAVGGNIDGVVFIRTKDRKELLRVIDKIQENTQVIRTSTNLILRAYKSSFDFNPLEAFIEWRK